jgi:3-hydroxymyristoyl/3-hydroxydecanoyl-(acyl carrier protein) dehydratase
VTRPDQASNVRPVLPEIVRRENESNSNGDGDGTEQVLYLHVPASLAWFDGHFPGDPILPAVVQIDWAIHFGTELGFDPARFSGMDRLKFRSVISPGTTLELRLEAAGDALRFSYESAAGNHSNGAILFRGHDDNPEPRA